MKYREFGDLTKYARDYCHERIRRAGISDTDHRIRAFLWFHEDVHQDKIAQAMGLDKTTVAKALTSFEGRGMIARTPNPDNRRKNAIRITESGMSAIAELVSVYDDWFARGAACLSEEEKQQFGKCCARLLSAARQIQEEEMRV